MLIWDHTVKERLQQYPKYVLRVQDIAFNADGSRLAVGVMARRPRSSVHTFWWGVWMRHGVGENEKR